jgi:DNA-binding XRE family transcriptional regulator
MPKYLQGYKPVEVSPREIRQKLKVSNTCMAQLLGVSGNTWLAWQSGKRIPSASAYRLMAVLLWLSKGGQLHFYWSDFAEPEVLRNYGWEGARPDPLVREEMFDE